MNLQAYSGKDIQLFLSILAKADIGGIEKIQTLRSALEARLNDIVLAAAMRPKNKNKLCPSCGMGVLEVHSVDGLQIAACRECRYSEVVQ